MSSATAKKRERTQPLAELRQEPEAASSGEDSLRGELEADRYRLLVEVAGLVVHDLSSPLYAMMCVTELLESNPAKAMRPDFCTNLKEAIDTALSLINTLKSYLRSPQDSPNDQALFGEAMRDTQRVIKMRLMVPLLTEEARDVEVQVAEELDLLSLAISRADLIHVLLNLVSNGYLAAQGGPSDSPLVRLEPGAVEASAGGQDVQVILISDNGPGLSSERYEALTSASRKQASGSSMGLKLTRRLVERKGGSLTIAARSPLQGPGTTFELRLPKAPPEAA